MARRRGSLAADHEYKRDAMLDRVTAYLIAAQPEKPSLRDLAAAASVSVPTIKHYFASRDELIIAVMTRLCRLGDPYLAQVADTDEPFAQSVISLVDFVLSGLIDAKVIDFHCITLREAGGSPFLGPRYLALLFEPLLAAIEHRLRRHIERGEMVCHDVRIAALMVLSPVFIAALHQRSLSGAQITPLSRELLVAEIAQSFTRAYQGPQ
ncbi:MAG: helix-turn-helix domain-containing protein [Alphaproteobacteria bacterium]|nr:helix-turn-helix domain-containing protein [Alphaproteobacteria bacterium]